jgi:hypothetical protein
MLRAFLCCICILIVTTDVKPFFYGEAAPNFLTTVAVQTVEHNVFFPRDDEKVGSWLAYVSYLFLD